MAVCVVLQAIFVTHCIRYYAGTIKRASGERSPFLDAGLLTAVMLIMLLGNFIQTGIWAVLFMVLGEIPAFGTALYFSAVNFATLGYGDIVLSQRWQLLGPLEAANGILMFGVSTAVMTAAVIDVLKSARARNDRQTTP